MTKLVRKLNKLFASDKKCEKVLNTVSLTTPEGVRQYREASTELDSTWKTINKIKISDIDTEIENLKQAIEQLEDYKYMIEQSR